MGSVGWVWVGIFIAVGLFWYAVGHLVGAW